MKSINFLSIIAVLFAGVNSLATSVRRAEDGASPIPEGFKIVDLEWVVETTPGGPNVTLTGTVEQVHDKLIEINPNWDEDFAPVIAKRKAELLAFGAQALAARGESPVADGLQKRDWTTCGSAGHGHQGARLNPIIDGVAYLWGLSGQASRGPGPRSCGQVACSWSSSIWYCNNNSFTKTMPWVHIANAAQVLINECSYDDGFPNGWMVRGERWHNDGWFAIVSKNTNCNTYT
ncbi:hypothetical protein QBC38DRAFT_462096 [Podospora fimiseda]|uniref:Secreted protein n=1 Tax=Podospora fimiseda TaxID=252190 RepID=A0AAN7BEJ2_9PEZI|nr:hypothetical protein QBC38DRAFT_462096 [Podospora fimiseda]